MKKLFATVATVALLAGCETPPLTVAGATPPSTSQQDAFENILTALGSTAIPQLQQQAAVALAETPPNVHVAQCAGTMPTNPADPTTGTGALSVAAAVQKLQVAAGPNPAPLTKATILLAFQPNGAQFNWAFEQIETGCVAALQDAINAGKATAADLANLNIGTVLTLAAVGAENRPIVAVAANR
jgi:hypothetical protein